MSYMKLVNGHALHESLVAQWLKHTTSVWKATGFIPVEDIEDITWPRGDRKFLFEC